MKNAKEKQIKLPEVTKVSHLNHRQRLLTTIKNIGLEFSNDLITMEFILTYVLPRVDTNPVAHRLLEKFGNIAAVLDASVEELQTVRGMGPTAAQKLTLLPDVFLRYSQDKQRNCKILTTRLSMVKYAHSFLQNKPTEELFAICLNKAYKVLSTKLLAKGTVNSILIDNKDFVRQIVNVPNAYYIILAHSHPNNQPNPSRDDYLTTDKLSTIIETIGFELLEHVIVSDRECFCMKEGVKYNV